MIPQFVMYNIYQYYPHSCTLWPIYNEGTGKFGCAVMRTQQGIYREVLFDIPDIYDSEDEAVAAMSEKLDIGLQTLRVQMN